MMHRVPGSDEIGQDLATRTRGLPDGSDRIRLDGLLRDLWLTLRLHRTSGLVFAFTAAAISLAAALLVPSTYRLGLVTIEGARSKVQEEINRLAQQQIDAQTELMASESKIEDLVATIDALPERLQTSDVTGLPNEATDRMRDRLYQLQIREKELLSKDTAVDPQVIEIRKQVADAERIYRQQGQEREQQRTEVHPAKQKLELLLMTERATAASLRGRDEALERRMQAATVELRELNCNDIRFAQMQRRIDLAEHTFRLYSDRLEQSRLDGELQSQRISNVNVIQQASYQEKPAAPPQLLILIGGLVFALVGGIATSLLADLVHPILKSAKEIEDSLAIPVVMTFPPTAPGVTLSPAVFHNGR